MDNIAVQFVRRHGIYQAGVVAGFPKATADDLIGKGVAKPYVAPAPKKEGFLKKMAKKAS